ncbi:MAG TPA: ABC-F family ATP-binding cassette domain-containing protein [Bacteroidales bacterium]|nr:ABC-F family ATP-binding cassette domain-containing protein [Bacteroidales bacterium]
MISVDQLSVSFGGSFLFNRISFMVNSHDKIGLVGRNGAGKTTLLKVFMGLQQADEGKVTIPPGIRLGYLPQQMVITDDKTLIDEAGSAFDEILILENEIKELNHQITVRTDYESQDYIDLIEQLSDKTERFHLLEGDNRNQRIEQVLMGLGFSRFDFKRHTREFSGGWRMRIELAKILLKMPDAVLLDEPTNHLDIDSIQWLEAFLHDYHGAVLLISHDRVFLDRVTDRTVEISLGQIYDYRVPYSKYVELRKERREQQTAAYNNQQKLINDTRDFIERFRYKPTKSVQVQSRIKMLEKLEIIEIDDEDTSSINIKFPPSPRSGNIVVDIKELSMSYGHHNVLNSVDLTVHRGEKVAFVGRNGEGKTTLSKIIAGELPFQGSLKIGHNVMPGYFAQNQDELLDGNRTVLETLDEVAVGDIRTKIRDILGAFLFRGEDVDKKVKVLSGGERSRLAMARLLLEPCNLLVLDEPTNHLDMRSKDILKKALLAYDGTLIAVSHDREFLDGLVTKVFEFRNKKIREHLGGIYEFLEKRRISTLSELERKGKPESASGNQDGSARQSFFDKKEYDRELRKIENRILKVESVIAGFEEQIAKTESIIANPESNPAQVQAPDFYSNYEKLRSDLNGQMEIWEQLQIELEQFKNKRI